MNIGDEITIKCVVVDFDANPHGPAIKVEVKGFVDRETINNLEPYENSFRFWIYRLDQPEVVVGLGNNVSGAVNQQGRADHKEILREKF